MWRIVSSPRFAVASPTMVMKTWTLEDVRDAHRVLDMYDHLDMAVATSKRPG